MVPLPLNCRSCVEKPPTPPEVATEITVTREMGLAMDCSLVYGKVFQSLETPCPYTQ